MIPESLDKRIRRHIRARIMEFFAICAPGLEKLCLKEISTLPMSVQDASLVEGGVMFKGRLWDMYLANLHLRTASRILMRIGELKATNFNQLEKKLSDFPWELYLSSDENLNISVSTHQSRLYHKDAIAEIVLKSIRNRIGNTASSNSSEHMFIRGMDDRFTLSIDTSGELLHKRGLKIHVGHAPIRETTAAAILQLAGYDPSEPLLDPLCGSGTFSLEAAMIAANIPAGWYRKFAFMNGRSFEEGRWKHIRREAEKQIMLSDQPLIFASDKNAKIADSLEKNISEYGLSKMIRVSCADIFESKPLSHPGLIVINPPYGKRIGTYRDSEEFFIKLCQHLHRNYRKWKFAILVPNNLFLQHIPFRFRSVPIFHGGINLDLIIGRINH